MTDYKIFVFLSHSHHDYEKVRLVRDLLENEGFRPLMFFLKCLDKEDYEELTKTLIREEIDSRQRFILCKSENADRSEWVKFEMGHIIKTNRPYESIDLDWPQNKIEETIKKFKIRSSVFLSYPWKLRELADMVSQQLSLYDFRLISDSTDLRIGDDIYQWMTDHIKKAAEQGYVLAFLDEDIQEHSFQFEELTYAMDIKSRIVPVITKKNIPDFVRRFLYNIRWIDISGMSNAVATEFIVQELIKYDIMLYQKNNIFYTDKQ